MGRPTILPDETTVAVIGETARTKLQVDSARRAIVNRVIDSGGATTIKRLCDHFGYDVRGVVSALIRNGWLREVQS